jgi:3-methyladenine DNA glycosylase AlkD
VDQSAELDQADRLAETIDAELRALPVQNTPSVRAVRRRFSKELQAKDAGFCLAVAGTLLDKYGRRWVAYELIAGHRAAFQRLGPGELEALGQGIDSWSSVDAFARILAGPAWLRGQVPDGLVHRWAASADRWWRRAALVSTVALNMRSHGGEGDTPRTLAICRRLVADGDDMVVKALSWALRALVPHDPGAVQGFLTEYGDVLAARVKREVRSKLTTGRKNPRPE